jgi:hypothetical protein
VLFPVPRGPRRKKLCEGALRILFSIFYHHVVILH